MSNTMDRTRFYITSSFYELLKRKSFKSITIQDICLESKIHRSTFYRYYQDKYELMSDVIQIIKKEFEHQMINNHDNIYDIIVDYIVDSEKLFEHILDDNELFTDIVVIIRNLIVAEPSSKRLITKKIEKVPDPTLLIDFYSSGIVYILKQWVTKKYAYSKEQLKQLIRELILE